MESEMDKEMEDGRGNCECMLVRVLFEVEG